MSAAERLFAEHGHKFMRYDPETGLFTYHDEPPVEFFPDPARFKMWRSGNGGRVAGSTHARGYIMLWCRGRFILAHRYAWFLTHGEWPKVTDHINGDPSDNRIVNLRSVDQSINMRNGRRRSDNKTGHPGVYFLKDRKKWRAEICLKGRSRSLGCFATKEEAVAVRKRAERRLGYGPNHNRCDHSAGNSPEGLGGVASFHDQPDSRETQQDVA